MRLDDVVGRLETSLPGVTQPWEQAVHSDWLLLRPAAVLVLLFPDEDDAAFFLTRRPDSLRSHPGQISLPGGRIEQTDATPWDAALRETWEEIGVPPAKIRPIGRLDPVQVTVSNNLVLPYVGWMEMRPVPGPPTEEVEEVIEVRLSDLLDPRSVEEEPWVLRDDRSYLVTYYRIGAHTVWGVTARILSNLAARLGAGPTDPYPPGTVRPARDL